MEDNFNHDDFEEFLQDQVRNHRMYPADGVWREIDKKLHGEKRWPALTIVAALLVSVTVLICVYFTPKSNILLIPTVNVNTSTQQALQKNNILTNLTPSASFDKAKNTNGSINAVASIVAKRSPQNSTLNVLHGVNNPKTDPATHGLVLQHLKNTTGTKPGNDINNTTSTEQPTSITPAKTGLVSSEVKNQVEKVDINSSRINKTKIAAISDNDNDRNMVDDFLKDHNTDIPLYTRSRRAIIKNKFSYQIYVAPSVSYRKLLEDNSMEKENGGGPVGLNYVTDVNKVVRHKPGTGIEAGVGVLYNVSEKVRVKSGFQFNMRQYSIEAYRSNTELASIALMGNNGFDTINTLAIYRNTNGYYSTQLVNRYYQISVPVGIEWEIMGNNLIQLNVAGTIQPTYLLNRNAYLLSSNFKNYTESPGMVRQWNINSNIEAFISLKAGDFKWQLGPQLRYQPYSTFIPEYTIKEHLLDYGIKLGVSKIIK
jgi:hypothetical protein